MATIYKDDYKYLKDLLSMASNDEGATLLIPDLQRPYVWNPTQVIVLIDSLIRGWPFGTLLTWKVKHDDPARALARSFWKVVDRTDSAEGEEISKKHPPASFAMVLDGQQRVQSLLLALCGDSWGFKLLDRQWHEALNGSKPRGARGYAHWSCGSLCVDLRALAVEYELARRIVAIDFTKVLQWVVTDSATGQSSFKKKESYEEPLPRSSDSSQVGRFIRLARLWKRAPEQEGIEAEEAEDNASAFLKEEGVAEDIRQQLLRPIGSLLIALGRVKQTRVNYLELAEYGSSHGSRESYNDAIVNIFTRLNTAGRTLTREDITFAWLKVGWKTALTANDSATRSFEKLSEQLKELGLELSSEDLVSATSFLWSVNFNDGKLLTNNDLLKGEAIRPMAEQMSEHWTLVVEAATKVCEHVKDRQLEFGRQYQSLNALAFLWAWYFAALRWRRDHTLLELEKDELQKRLGNVLNNYLDRWLICSQWAGRWAAGSGETFSGYASGLYQCAKELGNKKDVASIANHLAEHLKSEVFALEKPAVEAIRSMNAIDRKQVRIYATPLWIWNRLDELRWKMAKVALREKNKKRASLDVDHIVACDLWQKKLESPTGESNDALSPNEGELVEAVNQLGNCLLLEKTFNISKSNKPLKEFLDNVYDFKDGKLALSEWIAALNLEMPHVDSKNTTVNALQKLFFDRTAKIRLDLEDFVRGTKVRVDIDLS